MTNTTPYVTAKGRQPRQGFRPMTSEETRTLHVLAKRAPSSPPWTPQARNLRETRDAYVIYLYEQGITANTIAAAQANNLTHANVTRIIREHRTRLGTGRRINHEIPRREKPRNVRPKLTDAQIARINELDRAMPRFNTMRDWYSFEGRELIAYLTELKMQGHTLQQLGDVLDVSRERARQLIERAA